MAVFDRVVLFSQGVRLNLLQIADLMVVDCLGMLGQLFKEMICI